MSRETITDHADAIQILKLEIGRLRFCAVTPGWAHLRKSTLERCENAARSVRWLEEAHATRPS